MQQGSPLSSPVDPYSQRAPRGSGMYSDRIEEEAAAEAAAHQRRQELLQQQQLLRQRENQQLAKKLFSVFTADSAAFSASRGVHDGASSSATAAASSAVDPPPDAAAATAAAIAAVTAASSPLQARAALGALWQQHHCPRLSSLQRQLRLARQQAEAAHTHSAEAAATAGTAAAQAAASDPALGNLNRCFESTLQEVGRTYQSLYGSFLWRSSQQTLKEAKQLRTAGYGSAAPAVALAAAAAAAVAAAAHSETAAAANHSQLSSAASMPGVPAATAASEAESGAAAAGAGSVWGTAEESLLQADAALAACKGDTTFSRCCRLCDRHILAHIKVILADLAGYRARMEGEVALEELGSEPQQQLQHQQVLLLLRCQSQLPVGLEPLQRSCQLYGEALRLFPLDAAASTQLQTTYLRIFGGLHRQLQQQVQQQQQLLQHLPFAKREVQPSLAASLFRLDAIAAAFAAAATYWALRSAVGPFAAGSQDELTLLLQRLSNIDIRSAALQQPFLQQQHHQQQMAAVMWRTCGQEQNRQLLQQQLLKQQQDHQAELQRWCLLLREFARLLLGIHLRVDVDELPAAAAALSAQLSALLLRRAAGPAEAPVLLLLQLAAACAYLRATEATTKLQQSTEAVLHATRKLRQQQYQLQQQQHEQRQQHHRQQVQQLQQIRNHTKLWNLQQQQQQELHEQQQQQIDSTAARWEQLTSELYGTVSDSLLEMVEQQQQLQRERQQQQQQPELIQLRALQHGTPQMQAALDVCCSIGITVAAAARAALLSASEAVAVRAASPAAANLYALENSSPELHTVCAPSGSNNNSSSGCTGSSDGSSSSRDLHRMDSKRVSELRESVSALLPLLLNCPAILVAAASHEQQPSEQDHHQQQQEANTDEVSDLQMALQLSLPEDRLLLGLLRVPLELPQKTLLLQQLQQRQQDDAVSVSASARGNSPILPAAGCVAAGADTSHNAGAETDDDDLLLLKAPLRVLSARSASDGGPSSEQDPRGPPASGPRQDGASDAARAGSAKDIRSGFLGGGSVEQRPSRAPGKPGEEANEVSGQLSITLGGVIATRTTAAGAPEDLWANPQLAAARAARLLLMLLDSKELQQVMQGEQEKQQKLQQQQEAGKQAERLEHDLERAAFLQDEESADKLQRMCEAVEAAQHLCLEQKQQQPQQEEEEEAGQQQQQQQQSPPHWKNWPTRGSGSKQPFNSRGPRGHGGWGGRSRRGQWGGTSGPQDSTSGTVDAALSWGSHPRAPEGDREHLVVIDGCNVAMKHGDGARDREKGPDKLFSTKGILAALDYYQERGYKVRVFVPEYVLSYNSYSDARRQERAQMPVSYTRMPDCIEVLRKLHREGILICTPSQDYDDLYCIRYALMRGGCIITNDMYRDICSRVADKTQQAALRLWLKRHIITFTFVDGDFIPNPEFQWPPVDDPVPANIFQGSPTQGSPNTGPAPAGSS
ncbi:hypothetical protein, conserved [Eimeria necatrix]|uniref:RNase NYN domain-containing protein n=1 Tax=Eimeria necatrix TaxID=51315 RepID=U6MP62_9EIME|nr:hypothetical protein, conserved [Eimeria necatrix]CDJ66002.1 hypothetical protein, conserved [Eimeria necatrix]